MHWIEPAQLPAVDGTIERFLLNPHGELDGIILGDGTEVHFPPHLSEAVRAGLAPGKAVTVRGLRPRQAAMIAAVALTTCSGETIPDNGPADSARVRQDRQPLSTASIVARHLHGPKGEIRGALLNDGTILRLDKHVPPEITALLCVDRPIAAQGEGVDTPYGRCIAVRRIGTSQSTLVDLGSVPRTKPGTPRRSSKHHGHDRAAPRQGEDDRSTA